MGETPKHLIQKQLQIRSADIPIMSYMLLKRSSTRSRDNDSKRRDPVKQ